MKFDSYDQGFFAGLLDTRSRSRFHRAFSVRKVKRSTVVKNEKTGKDETVVIEKTEIDHDARSWCKDVMHLFADQAFIPYSLACHAFKTGDKGVEAILRHYERVALKAQDKVVRNDSYRYSPHEYHALKIVTQTPDLKGTPHERCQNFLRDRWVWCLGLSSKYDREKAAKEAA